MPNPTPEQLQSELTAARYLGRTPAEQADILNEKNIPVYPLVNSIDVASYLQTTVSHKTTDPTEPLSLYNILSLTYRDEAYSREVRAYAENIIDLATAVDRRMALHDNPLYDLAVAALVRGGVWSQDEGTGLLEFGKVLISRAEQLWGEGVTVPATQIAAMLLLPKAVQLAAIRTDAETRWSRVVARMEQVAESLAVGVDADLPTTDDLMAVFSE